MPMNTTIATPAESLWNQRHTIHELMPKFRQLAKIVNRPTDLELYQWIQLASVALEYQPQLIIELGRGIGNSTACFLEVCNRLGGRDNCQLLSLCLSTDWSQRTADRIRKSYAPSDYWFAPAIIEQTNILEYDIEPHLQGISRCLVFWDAHGFEVAECFLGKWLPMLEKCSHRILMHDISDTRFEGCDTDYGNSRIWHGESAANEAMFLGHIYTRVAQAISVLDFTTRNSIPFHSASESFSTEIGDSPEKLAEVGSLFGEDAARMDAHWFWFSLEEANGPICYPEKPVAASTTRVPWWIHDENEIEKRQVRRTPSAIKPKHKKRFEEFVLSSS